MICAPSTAADPRILAQQPAFPLSCRKFRPNVTQPHLHPAVWAIENQNREKLPPKNQPRLGGYPCACMRACARVKCGGGGGGGGRSLWVDSRRVPRLPRWEKSLSIKGALPDGSGRALPLFARRWGSGGGARWFLLAKNSPKKSKKTFPTMTGTGAGQSSRLVGARAGAVYLCPLQKIVFCAFFSHFFIAIGAENALILAPYGRKDTVMNIELNTLAGAGSFCAKPNENKLHASAWLAEMAERHAGAWLRKWAWSLPLSKDEMTLGAGMDEAGAMKTWRDEIVSIYRHEFLALAPIISAHWHLWLVCLAVHPAKKWDALTTRAGACPEIAEIAENLIMARKIAGKLSTAARDGARADALRVVGINPDDLESTLAGASRLARLSSLSAVERARRLELRRDCSALIAASRAYCRAVVGWSSDRRKLQAWEDKRFLLSAWRWACGNPESLHKSNLSSDGVRVFAARLRARLVGGLRAMAADDRQKRAARVLIGWLDRSGASVGRSACMHVFEASSVESSENFANVFFDGKRLPSERTENEIPSLKWWAWAAAPAIAALSAPARPVRRAAAGCLAPAPDPDSALPDCSDPWSGRNLPAAENVAVPAPLPALPPVSWSRDVAPAVARKSYYVAADGRRGWFAPDAVGRPVAGMARVLGVWSHVGA